MNPSLLCKVSEDIKSHSTHPNYLTTTYKVCFTPKASSASQKADSDKDQKLLMSTKTTPFSGLHHSVEQMKFM